MRNAIETAIQKLLSLGFEPDLTEETYQNIVNAGFQNKTLPQVFVLAQVLLENQPISVRGAFYRAVSAGIFPNTDDKYYRQTGNILLKLRRARIIPYSWIADSTRQHVKPSSWAGIEDFGETASQAYRKDLWAKQPAYLEIIVEKDAMAGVLRPVTEEYDVGLNIIRGNSSETFVWNLSERIRDVQKPVFLYYLGDHDPNGLDIERDMRERLQGFLGCELAEWHRLAITTSEFFSRSDLTGFPVRKSAKSKSWRTRCARYIGEHGDRCVEIDALRPNEIRDRLRMAIEAHIDQTAWQQLRAIEQMERETIAEGLRKFVA